MKKISTTLLLIFCFLNINAQDVIYKNDGTEIKAKVIEITTEAVKYKNYDQLEGPLRNISLTDVFMIIYQDGLKEVYRGKIDKNKELQISNKVMPKIEKTQYIIPSNDQDYCFKGRQDAERYYTGYTGAGSGTAVTTVLFGPIIGLIPAIACSSTSPKRSNLTFPDSKLMKNSGYYSCYTQEAKRIKSKKVWKNFGIGFAVNFTIIMILAAASGGG